MSEYNWYIQFSIAKDCLLRFLGTWLFYGVSFQSESIHLLKSHPIKIRYYWHMNSRKLVIQAGRMAWFLWRRVYAGAPSQICGYMPVWSIVSFVKPLNQQHHVKRASSSLKLRALTKFTHEIWRRITWALQWCKYCSYLKNFIFDLLAPPKWGRIEKVALSSDGSVGHPSVYHSLCLSLGLSVCLFTVWLSTCW